MRFRLIAVCAAILVFPITVVRAQEQDTGLGTVVDRTQTAPPPAPKPESDEEPDAAESLIKELSLVARVSQLMIFKLEGISRPLSGERGLIRDFPPGGLIIPRITRPRDAAEYVSLLRSSDIESKQKIPLLIGIDLFSLAREETRPIQPYLNIPSMLTWAGAGASDATRGLARIIAQDLRRMGFNLHLGPSLELASIVPSEEGNVYNFGSDPAFIAAVTDQIAEVMAEEGIIWLPMGFPGGGENRGKKGPAVLLTPKSQLRGLDLLPYETAIQAGVEMIHVGNTLIPTLDTRVMASASPIVMTDLLRNILDFEGLVVAGPMDADAVRMGRGSSEAAVLALQAGADMLYWEKGGIRIIRAIGTIVKAVGDGTIDEALVNTAFERVIRFKESQGLLERPKPKSKDAEKLTKERAKAKEPYQIERRAVTLVKNDGDVLPLSEEESMPIYIAGSYGVYELADAAKEYMQPILRQRIASARHVGRIEDFEIERIVRATGGAKTMICVLSGDIAPAGQMRLIKILREAGSKVVVVFLGHPANVAYFEEADAIVLAYADPNTIGVTMNAVADVLMGNGPVEILPALRDLDLSVNQESTFDVYDVIRSPTGRLPVSMAEPYVAGYAVSYRPVLALERIAWDFGDGAKSRDRVAVHSYNEPGQYQVTLTIETGLDAPVSREFRVVVK